jgi:hypothetical protein
MDSPIALTIDQLLGKPSPKVAWLLQVGEQLRRERINSPEADGAGVRSPAPLASQQGQA